MSPPLRPIKNFFKKIKKEVVTVLSNIYTQE